MPLYDYQCQFCQRTFEEHRSVDDRKRDACCPSCGADSQLVITKVPPFKLGMGCTRSGVYEWGRREKERLTKRALDHDNSPRGKEERMASIERQVKRGNFV